MSACFICNIATNGTRARLVDTSESAIAFFPCKPEVRGHTLVAPRKHIQTWENLPPEWIGPFFVFVQLVSRQLCATLDAQSVNVLFAGGPAAQQSVPHFHVHVLPRWEGDGVDAWPHLPGCDDDLDALLAHLKRDGLVG